MGKKKIYTIATAHLDTVWSWDLEESIDEYINDTFEQNFKLLEKYPTYKFNFEGAYRYELMEEYYPELFEQLKVYVEKGKWNVAGSSYENGDVNVPSPELLFRNILYGNGYFEKTFGRKYGFFEEYKMDDAEMVLIQVWCAVQDVVKLLKFEGVVGSDSRQQKSAREDLV